MENSTFTAAPVFGRKGGKRCKKERGNPTRRSRRLTAAILLGAMLLTLVGGGLTGVFAAQNVVTKAELAYDPLAEAASIAYEQHEAGYVVSLDRAADSVTMNITGVPKNGRTADKARLFIHTGVELKAGTTYRVSFALSAEQAQEYAVSFDAGTAKAAYGRLDGRSVEAGAADRVSYEITPEKNRGELVLRLLLGKTGAEGNTFRFSGLAVEEASGEEIGENVVLVDSLDYNAPGAVTCWTNTGFRVGVTSGGNSTTLTMLQKPKKAEVWETQLKIATGFTPEPGKIYRVSAGLNASAAVPYEICLNEGGIEKGYDAIYGLWLDGGSQSFSRMLSVAEDKENPGELIIQFSLGNMKVGDKVTVSNIRVAEASGKYNNALPNGYAYDKTWEDTGIEQEVSGGTAIDTDINWSGKLPSVTASGDHIGKLTPVGNSATLEIGNGSDSWHARLNIDTAADLKAGTTYNVSFKIKTKNAYEDGNKYEVLYGTGLNGVDNNKAYGGPIKRTLTANSEDTITYSVTPSEDGGLLISLQLGATKGQGNTVTVSDFTIEELTKTYDIEENTVTYPEGELNDTFEARDGLGTITGDGESVTVTCTDVGHGYQRALFINNICELEGGAQYQVEFNITGAADKSNVRFYGNDNKYQNDPNLAFQDIKSESVTQKITAPEDGGNLYLRIDLEKVAKGTQVKVSNIKVTKLSDNGNEEVSFSWVYPDVELGTFEARENSTSVVGDGESYATITIPKPENEGSNYSKALYVNEFCDLKGGRIYEVSFKLQATNDVDCDVKFCNPATKWEGDYCGGDFNTSGKATSAGTVVKKMITPKADGKVTLRLDLEKGAVGTDVTISDISVKEVTTSSAGTSTLGEFNTSAVWVAFANNPEEGTAYEGSLIRHKDSAEIVTWKPAGSRTEGWGAKLCIDTGIPYEAGKAYRVSFDITSPETQREFCAVYTEEKNATIIGKDNRGTWGQTLVAGEKKTIVSPGLTGIPGNIKVDVELGKFNGTSNSATVSNLQVEEVNLTIGTVHKITGNVNVDAQSGYDVMLDRQKDSVTVDFSKTPSSGAEFWKAKLFFKTDIPAGSNQGFKISFDALAEKDADFEVCYNQGDTEKGLGALYGLHLKAGEVQTIEATCGAAESKDPNDLRIQLNLGMVQGPNKITISNLKIERANFTFSGKNLANIDYRAPSAVSYWAHEDYTVNITGSDSATTANITEAPAGGPEGWKVKLWVDTGVMLQPGKYYKVTANVTGKKSQDFDVCYNNGGVENGYDSMGGLRLVAGKLQTVEKLISVPADKADASNLVLQFNLGKTSAANAVTVSGVTVEEVSLGCAEMMAKNFSYKGAGTSLWTYNDYTATLEQGSDRATAHITSVPSDAAVWKVKLFVNTGVMLQPGRTYRVSADMEAPNAQSYEVCYNNEEIEKGFDALYGQYLPAATKTTVEKNISVPASMTDAGELILQFAVGGNVTNDVTVSNVSVQELTFGAGGSGNPAPDTVIDLSDAAGTLDVTREKLTYKTKKLSSKAEENAITIAGANLCAGDWYTAEFTAHADRDLTGRLVLRSANGEAAVISEPFQLTAEETTYSFTTAGQLSEAGLYDLLWQFDPANDSKQSGAEVELSNISIYSPAETLEIAHNVHHVTVNGKAVLPDTYVINGSNYIKLRDLAMVMNGTDAQFTVRYNKQDNLVSLTTGKAYTPVGGEMKVKADRSATCMRTPQDVTINGAAIKLKAYNIGGSNFFRIRDLGELLGFKVDYVAASSTVAISSALTPEAQEEVHAYDLFFLPEVDGEAQPYVGDTMPFYDNGVYYIYYLKDGGDSYNHSVYVVSTTDFVHYTEYDHPVLSASREDVQDNWIGTGSVVKVDNMYYFFYTGFNASGSQEYHEKIMVAKSSSPTGTFEKVRGWEIVPPASLGQKNDFRDPQAYYDPATQTISLTITAPQGGTARILKYTLNKDLGNATYDGIIFTDPIGFWNLECSDTFKLGNKWYLTYSGQDDTLWYAMADSRFGPYSAPVRLDGKLFYAAKHVENGTGSYMVGWARRSNSASSTQEVSGWAGNMAVQKLSQRADGSLVLVPVDSIVSAFNTPKALGATSASLSAGSDRSYKAIGTSSESFMLKGEFTYSGTGAFGLAFDFNGSEEQYKLISLDPAANKLNLSLNGGAAFITETQAALQANQKHSFTYIQDGSVGIFYLDGQASLTVRLYGVTDKPIYLFAENNSVTFTSLQQYTR